MLSISVPTSSQITHLTRSDGAGSGKSPAASATGLQAACGTPEPGSQADRNTPHPPHPAPQPLTPPLSSTAAGRSRLPVLQSGKPSRKTARLRSMAFFHTGRPPASLKPGSERIPLSERPYSSKPPVKGRSGISPTGSPDGLPETCAKFTPPHQRHHPLTVPRHTSDSASCVIVPAPLRPAQCRKCAASAPSLPPEQHSLTAFPRLPSGPLSPSDNAHPVGSVAAAVQEKPSLDRTPSAPERRAEL